MEIKNPVEEKYMKMNFFEKFWYSVTKFEKYPEMASSGTKKAIIYFTKLMVIFSIIVTAAYVYYVEKIATYEEDLSFPQKLIAQIDKFAETPELNESVQILGEYSNITLVTTIFFSLFIAFFILTLIDVLSLSVFGIFTCFIAKIKMSYNLIFNMSIFALTLSITLKAAYLLLNIITAFQIKYFEIMYIAIAYICLAAAIFMIKSDVIKQQMELMKIIQEGKEKIEQVIPKKQKEDEEDEEEDKNDEVEKKKSGTEGQGSNA